jgi:predicted RND superfamily exporter protein
MTLPGTASGDQTESFLPPGSDLAQTQERIQADFGARTAIIPVQLIVRANNVLEPTALREALALSEFAASEAGDFIVGAPFGYAQSIARLMGGTNPADATLADVETTLPTKGTLRHCSSLPLRQNP